MLGSGASLGRLRVFMSKHGSRSAQVRDGGIILYTVSFSLIFDIIVTLLARFHAKVLGGRGKSRE
jgi:hypothetical protein